MESPTADLDAAGTLLAAGRAVEARRAAEVEELVVAGHWADLHGEPRDERDPMTQPGGDGTPGVREYCLPELAMMRETHTLSTRSLVADALDLRHRLPLTWARVQALACEPWVARKVAGLSRKVMSDRIGVVDRAVASAISGHAPSTVLEIAAAKVIEADTEAHAMQRERDRHRRYVSVSRVDEFGFRHLVARLAAGDAARVDAMVDRVADILTAEHGHDHTHDELRSLAMGWLTRPVQLLKLLLEHTDLSAGEQPAWAPDDMRQAIERLVALSPRQLAALFPQGTINVHVTDEALRRQSGIARVEGLGPMLVQSLSELFAHANVRVQPVIDLNGRPRVDQYEHPDPVKDQAWLLAGGDCFPFSPRSATRTAVDFDHCTAFLRDGPPGQTGTHNSGPLRRRHHRWKTFGGYRCRQAGPGRYLWQTPHGLCFLVDRAGSHALPPEQAEAILTAPAGVDIYPGTVINWEN